MGGIIPMCERLRYYKDGRPKKPRVEHVEAEGETLRRSHPTIRGDGCPDSQSVMDDVQDSVDIETFALDQVRHLMADENQGVENRSSKNQATENGSLECPDGNLNEDIDAHHDDDEPKAARSGVPQERGKIALHSELGQIGQHHEKKKGKHSRPAVNDDAS
jgi:hypothetical protein